MDRIKGAGNVNQQFVAENPVLGLPPTEITAEWLNGIQEVLARFIMWAGIQLSDITHDQLKDALLAKFTTKADFDALIASMPSGIAQATNGEVASGANVQKFVNPAQVLMAIGESGQSAVSQASDVEVAAGANVQKYVNPHQLVGLIVARLEALPIVKGGVHAVGGAQSNTDVQVDFDTPFMSACTSVVVTPYDTTGNASSHDNQPIVTGWNRFGFTFVNNNSNPAGDYLAAVSYMAVGN